jgi:hypothetical protein
MVRKERNSIMGRVESARGFQMVIMCVGSHGWWKGNGRASADGRDISVLRVSPTCSRRASGGIENVQLPDGDQSMSLWGK